MGLAELLCRLFRRPPVRSDPGLKEIFQGFKQVLAANNEALILMGRLEEVLASPAGLRLSDIKKLLIHLETCLSQQVAALARMSGDRWPELERVRQHLAAEIHQRLVTSLPPPEVPTVVLLAEAAPEIWSALGGKAGNLARLVRELHLPVPPAAVATFTAYQSFMEHNPHEGLSLADRLQAQLENLDRIGPEELEQKARALKALILAQPLPEALVQSLVETARLVSGTGQTLVVRSSGLREDLAASFAGQFDSFLGVTPEEVPERWRQVVASQFSYRSLTYFREHGFALEEAAMGVLLQQLVVAEAAGVMFTRDPEGVQPDSLLVSATFGLGPELAAGEISGDQFWVDKSTGKVRVFHPGKKSHRLSIKNGRVVREVLPSEQSLKPALKAEDLKVLAGMAQVLEDYFGGPQDVEWVKDPNGQLWVVQCRPLPCPSESASWSEEAVSEVGAEVLLSDALVGARGVAAGPVYLLKKPENLGSVPEGVVLLVPRTTPRLTPVIPRVAALVAEVGSPTGHLALVAREYGIPALVEAPGAWNRLPPGETVTVDAYQGRVYRGRVEKLLARRAQPGLSASPLYDRVRAVLDLVTPLTQVDPRSPEFRPENCRTYHDLAYFAHEKAMQVMFGLMDQVAEGRVPALRLLKLDTPLPLNLHLVDLGDGLASHISPVPPEAILSIPMRALWRGISHPGITWAGPIPVDLGGFLHVLGQAAMRPPEDFWDKTYAIVAANYVNYACRLGYHFQSVDSYVGPSPEENYLNFNFKGGAADESRRIRRARLIAMVLEQLGFEVEQHRDVIRARCRKRPMPEMEERLEHLGRLMAYVRQMDMLMKDDAMVQVLVERFLAGHYERPGQEDNRGPGLGDVWGNRLYGRTFWHRGWLGQRLGTEPRHGGAPEGGGGHQ